MQYFLQTILNFGTLSGKNKDSILILQLNTFVFVDRKLLLYFQIFIVLVKKKIASQSQQFFNS